MDFKDRIKHLREEKGLNLTQLAVQVDLKEAGVRAWELGRTKPGADTLIKLAEHFDCTTDYLLGISDIRNEEAKKHNDEVIQKFATLNTRLNSPLVIEQFAYSLEAAAALAKDLEAFNKTHIDPLENYIIIVAELYNMFKLFYQYGGTLSDENSIESEFIEGYIMFVKSLSSHKDNISSLASELSSYFLDIVRALSLKTNEIQINIEKENEDNAET